MIRTKVVISTKVVLAVKPQLLRELLRRVIEEKSEMEIECEVFDPIDLLLAVKDTEADVVVMNLSESHRTPEICTHLLTEFPDLLVIGISAQSDRAYAYRSAIVKQECLSVHDMLTVMCTDD